MDEDHKHCIIDMDPNLRDAIDRFRETNHISSWAQEYGNYKADKGNGVIVVQLSGSASASRNMQTNKKYLTYRGGIRLVLIRTSTDENGTQFLQAKGVFDEADPISKAAYSTLLSQYGAHGFEGYGRGRPCNDQDPDYCYNTRRYSSFSTSSFV